MLSSDLVQQKLLCDQSPVCEASFSALPYPLFLAPLDADSRLEVCNPGPRSVLEDIKDETSLKQYVEGSQGAQAFVIRQRNSYSCLSVSEALFAALLREKNVCSQFREYLLYMGERYFEVEIAPSRLRWRPSYSSGFGGPLNGYECMYGLRFVELNGRENVEKPTSRWSLRQSAVYCGVRNGQSNATWILVTPSKLAQRRLNEHFSHHDPPNPSSEPFELHLLLLDSATSNWRPYLVDLAAEIEMHAEQVLGSATNGAGPIDLANCGSRPLLMTLDEKMMNARLAIESTKDTANSQLAAYDSKRRSELPSQVLQEDAISFMYSEQLQELDLLLKRVDSLRCRLKGITNLVSSFLDLSSGFALQNLAKESAHENEEMRKLSVQMAKMTKKSTQDAAAVKVLTILTLIYLPATVVSNFFSTSFVGQKSSPGEATHLFVSGDWWILLAASVPLTLLTLYVWLVWMRIQAYRRYPWWWIWGRKEADDVDLRLNQMSFVVDKV